MGDYQRRAIDCDVHTFIHPDVIANSERYVTYKCEGDGISMQRTEDIGSKIKYGLNDMFG